MTKRYHAPATPYQRLLADPRTSGETRRRAAALYAGLDPVHLLQEIRTAQQRLVEIADQTIANEAAAASAPTVPTVQAFLAGLRTAWQAGEVRPTSRPKQKAKRGRRRPDPLVAVTEQLRAWFEAEPSRTARELLEWLQAANPASTRTGCCAPYNGG